MKSHSLFIITIVALILAPLTSATPPYRGWGYAVAKLKKLGVPERELRFTFENKALPLRPFVPFGLHPKESMAMYSQFTARDQIKLALEGLQRYQREYGLAEQRFNVPREVINAILLVETRFGKIVGTHRVIERLARGVSVSEEWNVRENYQRLLKEGEKTSLSAVRKRALQVEQIFLPELRALFKIGLRERINILNIRGSSAGAFGWPQFMPLAYLRFSVDGNKDGRISLFNPADAIFSVANYLKYHGWRNNNNYRDQLKVIWHYNKSTPYGRAVLEVARITSRR